MSQFRNQLNLRVCEREREREREVERGGSMCVYEREREREREAGVCEISLFSIERSVCA